MTALVRKAGSATEPGEITLDAQVIAGAKTFNAAMTMGATVSTSISGAAHIVNGAFNAGATSTAGAGKRLGFNVNSGISQAWLTPRNSASSTLGGCAMFLIANTVDTSQAFQIYTNLATENDASSGAQIASATQHGAWIFGRQGILTLSQATKAATRPVIDLTQREGNCLWFGHPNSNYNGVLGGFSSNGDAFIGAYFYHSNSGDQLRLSGTNAPSMLRFKAAGGLDFYATAAQTPDAVWSTVVVGGFDSTGAFIMGPASAIGGIGFAGAKIVGSTNNNALNSGYTGYIGEAFGTSRAGTGGAAFTLRGATVLTTSSQLLLSQSVNAGHFMYSCTVQVTNPDASTRTLTITLEIGASSPVSNVYSITLAANATGLITTPFLPLTTNGTASLRVVGALTGVSAATTGNAQEMTILRIM